MTAKPTLGDFADFMKATTGFAPFPWQERLARQVLQGDDRWPHLLDLPTGVGKTSVLAIALFCMAMRPESTPRRIVLVVDRRVIVDQVHKYAVGLVEKLESKDAAHADPRGRVAAALRTLRSGRDGPAVTVSVLRGGVPRDDRWLSSPDQPAIVVSTVDQVGSRLLFRGYGVSESMRPVHAGVLGRDTLFFLDEVHLATEFEQTLGRLTEYMSSRWCEQEVGRAFGVVRMSATPPATRARQAPTEAPFQLDEDDRRHPVLQKRLLASKPATLEVVKTKREVDAASRLANSRLMARTAAARAKDAIARGARAVGIVVNRVATARAAMAVLERDQGVVPLLITGRMRPLDREAAQADIETVAAAGSEAASKAERPTVVVATSCIEAGADLDFDALITEAASLPSMRQRFGRLNRLGAREQTPAWILAGKHQLGSKAKPDPIYGDTLRSSWAYLESIATDGAVEFGVRAFVLPESGDLLEKVTGRSTSPPLLFPKYLDMLSETRPTPSPDPDVALWLHGAREDDPDVNVVFRAELDAEYGEHPSPVDPQEFAEQLEFMPPLANEAVAIRIGEFRRWAADTLVQGGEGTLWRWRAKGAERVALGELRPHDTVLVPCCQGGLRAGSWDPEATDPVEDLADLATLERAGSSANPLRAMRVRLQTSTLPPSHRGYPKPPTGEAAEDPQAWSDVEQELLKWFQDGDANPTPPEVAAKPQPQRARAWSMLFQGLAAAASAPETTLRARPHENDEGGGWRVTLLSHRRPVAASTEDNWSSFTGQTYDLDKHLDEVRAWAAALARANRLKPGLAQDLALAGLLHDVGKADPRFQLWLHGGDPVAATSGNLLAKSKLHSSKRDRDEARRRSRWPSGLRHELVSLALFEGCEEVRARANDPELVAHLIASHHGWCRPWAPAALDPEPRSVQLQVEKTSMMVDTSAIDADFLARCPARFRVLCRRYGWHGLAYLESILRLSDHRASASPGSRPQEVS